MQRLGIFGGSFDPVHNGHVIMASEAIEHAHLDELLVVPAHIAPHKSGGPQTTNTQRIELLRLAFGGLDRTRVDLREIERGGVSYTVETVAALAREHPDHELFFLLGADSVADLPKWKDIDRLARLCTFLAAPRPGIREENLADIAIIWVPGTPVGISSSHVRTRARRGLPLAGFVPENVAERLTAWNPYRDER